MRKIELITGKGSFLVIESDSTGKVSLPKDREYQELGRLANLSEEDFALIVDNKNNIELEDGTLVPTYRNYLYHDIQAPHIWKRSSKESFDTLILSHNIPLQDDNGRQSLYKPIILKLL